MLIDGGTEPTNTIFPFSILRMHGVGYKTHPINVLENIESSVKYYYKTNEKLTRI